MQKINIDTIGLDLGSKSIGVSQFRNGLYHNSWTLSLNSKWTYFQRWDKGTQELRDLLNSLDFYVAAMVEEPPPGSYTSALLYTYYYLLLRMSFECSKIGPESMVTFGITNSALKAIISPGKRVTSKDKKKTRLMGIDRFLIPNPKVTDHEVEASYMAWLAYLGYNYLYNGVDFPDSHTNRLFLNQDWNKKVDVNKKGRVRPKRKGILYRPGEYYFAWDQRFDIFDLHS